ncbi:MAG: putative zinc-binding metallopeptidase [Gammaproteobacteria bacterium]|jgi:hypothetical protein|nr:putative zinc-binding metallopeptidase [Gammaproteobacteria bacterium]
MKAFFCSCGQRVFFDSTQCVACGAALGFDPTKLEIVPITADYWACQNNLDFQVCNWLLPANTGLKYCMSCGLNEIIPNLGKPENLTLWHRLEGAKRRLLYTLLSLQLDFQGDQASPGLRFRFLEDRRRNPDALEEFVATGHLAGTITINVAEADDVERTEQRNAMQERYRTLLGHFRHEAGHYYYGKLVCSPEKLREWRGIFGDERVDYGLRMQEYYADGPPPAWAHDFVSSYATAHPHEDWAESFSHYLHIIDALETLRSSGMTALQAGAERGWLLEWMQLSVTLNELNRSLGLDDAYPFVQSGPVIDKLEFIDRLVHQRGA